MNLEQMEYIVKVANEKSITRAAEKSHITTSAISQSITQLENELGILIFNRSRNGTIPTEAGQIVINRANKILNNTKLLIKEIEEFKTSQNNHFKILTSPAISYVLLQAYAKIDIQKENITVDVQVSKPNEIMENIKYSDYDLCFLPQSRQDLMKVDSIKYELIYKDRVCIAVGKNSPFYNTAYVTQNDLKNAELIVDTNASAYISEKYIKPTNKVVLTTNNSNMIIEALKSSKAFLYALEKSSKNHPEFLNGTLKFIPLKEKNEYIYKGLYVIYPKSKSLPRIMEEFIEIIRQI